MKSQFSLAKELRFTYIFDIYNLFLNEQCRNENSHRWLVQALRRLVASKTGFEAFTTMPGFRDRLGKRVIAALKVCRRAVQREFRLCCYHTRASPFLSHIHYAPIVYSASRSGWLNVCAAALEMGLRFPFQNENLTITLLFQKKMFQRSTYSCGCIANRTFGRTRTAQQRGRGVRCCRMHGGAHAAYARGLLACQRAGVHAIHKGFLLPTFTHIVLSLQQPFPKLLLLAVFRVVFWQI
jgi:hypothetical protein